MRAALPRRRRSVEGAGLNILLLTSEFAPSMGGIGTYAREIAAAASRLGAEVTVIAPDYARQTDAADRSLPFEVVRFSGGLHSMRDLPRKILLARRSVRGRNYDVVHAADWPFFVPLALSRWRTPARVLMTVHGTEINETQTPLKRLAIRGAGVFGPRTEVVANSRFTEALFRERFAGNTTEHWLARLDEQDLLCAPVLKLSDALVHEQTRANGSVVSHEPGDPLALIGSPLTMDPSAFRIRHAPPALGADGDAVLAEAGFPASRIRALREAGVLS